MKVVVPSTKNILAPLGITATALAIDTGIKKKYMVQEPFNNFKRRNEWYNKNYSGS